MPVICVLHVPGANLTLLELDVAKVNLGIVVLFGRFFLFFLGFLPFLGRLISLRLGGFLLLFFGFRRFLCTFSVQKELKRGIIALREIRLLGCLGHTFYS